MRFQFIFLTLKPGIGLQPDNRTISHKGLKLALPWTWNQQEPLNLEPSTQGIGKMKTQTWWVFHFVKKKTLNPKEFFLKSSTQPTLVPTIYMCLSI